MTQYPKQLSDEARVRLLDALQRTIWTGRDIVTSPHSRPRCIIGREARDVFRLAPGPNMDDLSRCRTIPENHHIPFVDGTMYLGAKDDAVMIRLMDKVKDRQRPDGTCEQLDADRRRVRIEVSLKENELARLGIREIGSLRALKLTRLQGDYFQFRLPTFKIGPTQRAIDAILNTQEEWRSRTYQRTGVIGLSIMDAGSDARRQRMATDVRANLHAIGKKGSKTRRAGGSSFVAYEELNRKVALALRDLAMREERM